MQTTTIDDVDRHHDAAIDVLVDVIKDTVKPLTKRIAQLETALDA